MTTLRRVMVVIGALSLTGCPWLRQPEPPVVPEADGLEPRLAAYYAYASGLDEKAWREEVERRNSQISKGLCDASRLRLAMLLAHAPDDGELGPTRGVLDPCLEVSGEPRRWPTLVRVLQVDLEKRRDELARLDELGTELQQAQERNRELARQVEALKAIERSIRERDKAAPQPNGE